MCQEGSISFSEELRWHIPPLFKIRRIRWCHFSPFCPFSCSVTYSPCISSRGGEGGKCNFQPTLQLIAHLVNIFSICSVIVFGAKWLSTAEILWHESKHLQTPESASGEANLLLSSQIVRPTYGFQWPLVVLTCSFRLALTHKGLVSSSG